MHRRRRRARGRDRRPGPRVPRHADGRPHPRHPRRAHHLRRQARALGAAGAPRPRAAARGPASAIAVGKLSGAVGTYSNVDPVGRAVRVRARSGSRRCRRPRCSPATATPRCSTRARRSARRSSRSRSRSATCSAPRCARSRSRSAPGEQKGSSAMPHKRNPVKSEQLVRAGPRAARQPAGRARGRRAVARARHLALVGRAHHPPRLADARVLRAREVHGDRRGPARVSRAHAARTSTRRSASCSASRCCSRSSRRARSRDDAYRIVQRNAMRTWEERAAVPRRARARTPTSPARSTTRALDACFDLKRALAQHRPRRSTRSTTLGELGRAMSRPRCRTSTPARSASSTRSATTAC